MALGAALGLVRPQLPVHRVPFLGSPTMRNAGMNLAAILVAVVWMAASVPECPAQKKADAIKVTAKAIHKEFTDNAEKAREKYVDKFVEVSGVSGGQTGSEVFFLKEKKEG